MSDPNESDRTRLPQRKPDPAGAQTLQPSQTIIAQSPPSAETGATTDFSVEQDSPKPTIGPARHKGESIANYDILAELGRGGMGVVYKAQDRRLGRLVALKVILAGGHAGTAERQRFQVEVEAAARLQHPNIAQVYEVGEENGQPFMVMEYCPGGTLESHVRDKPQPPREAAQIVATLAEALHHAHQQGIIHRDIKPGNVLLSADGAPKVVDFGLAKRLDGADGFTQTGAIMGSLGYMAPEQAAGRTREATAATDVYSLGAVLYKLLTGRPPFHGPSDLETINSIVARDPVSIRSLQPRVPLDLVTICHKSLEKNPARRYASAAAMADDLRRYLNDQAIQARPLSPGERAWRWTKRNRGVALVLVAGIVMLLLMAACMAWSSYRSYTLMVDVNQIQRPLQELSGRIKYLDEVLTSSAMLASATGDVSWQVRYQAHDAQLNAALKEAVRLSPDAQKPLAEVDAANTELVKLESEAFAHVQQGQSATALQLLKGDKYRSLKQRYADALTSFIAHLELHQQTLLAQAHSETRVFLTLATVAALIIVLLLVAAGWVTLRSIRRA